MSKKKEHEKLRNDHYCHQGLLDKILLKIFYLNVMKEKLAIRALLFILLYEWANSSKLVTVLSSKN